MGGTALGKQLPRLSQQQYCEIVSELKTKLSPEFYDYVQEPRSFPSKTSFGDVDLLVTRQVKQMDPVKDLQAALSVINGNIVSMEYKGFQVDLIKIPEDRIDLSMFFYGYGDVGMIMGMFMRNLGLKFGMNNLTLKLETYKIKLSHELRDILRFLDLDYDAWQRGFGEEEDFFAWIRACKFFRPSFFAHNAAKLAEDVKRRSKHCDEFEEPTIWGHEARTRLAQRPMFRNFIEYVSTLPMNSDRIDKNVVRQEALDFFDKKAEHAAIENHLALTRRVKAKFNGVLTQQWIDHAVGGKALGQLIASFRQEFPMEVLDSMSMASIQAEFTAHFIRSQDNLAIPVDSI